jgi:hypothetical protein
MTGAPVSTCRQRLIVDFTLQSDRRQRRQHQPKLRVGLAVEELEDVLCHDRIHRGHEDEQSA